MRDLDHILDIYGLRGAEVLSKEVNLNTVWRVRHGAHEYVVKRTTRPATEARYLEQVRASRLMSFVRIRGLPCPLPLPDQRGNYVVNFKGNLYGVSTALEGMPSPDQVTRERVEQAGELLGRFHQLQVGFPDVPSARDLRGQIRRGLARLTEEWQTFGIKRTDLWDANREAQDHLDGRWHLLDGLPTGFMHADATPGNVLFAGECCTGLIDFEPVPGTILLDALLSAVAGR